MQKLVKLYKKNCLPTRGLSQYEINLLTIKRNLTQGPEIEIKHFDEFVHKNVLKKTEKKMRNKHTSVKYEITKKIEELKLNKS